MKKNVFALVVAFIAFGLAASAQTEKGSWLVGGNINLNTAKENTVITFTPMAGYFFINNFAAGAEVSFNYSKIADGKTTQFGAGPFARYYFGTMNIRPLVHASIDFTSTNTKVGTTASSTSTGSNVFVAGGLAAFINRNVAIEGLAGYQHYSVAHNDNHGGFGLRIGFQVYLSRYQVSTIKNRVGM